MNSLNRTKKKSYVYFRMDIEYFDELFLPEKEDIKKKHSNFREPIEPAQGLADINNKVSHNYNLL